MRNYFRNSSTEKKIEKHCFKLLEKYEAHKIPRVPAANILFVHIRFKSNSC
jgi:hypothetical protein